MVRKVLRTPAVLQATGWSKATLYSKIASGLFPPGPRSIRMAEPLSGLTTRSS